MPPTIHSSRIDDVAVTEPRGVVVRVAIGDGHVVLSDGLSFLRLSPEQALDLAHALTTAEHALRQQNHVNRVVTDTLGPELAELARRAVVCDMHGLGPEPCYWCSDEGADGVRR